MEPSKLCFDLVRSEEGLIPPKADGLYHAYHGKADRPGVWTIGVGMTWYPKGKAVREGDTITKEEVESMFEWHVNRVADAVDALFTGVTLTQSKFDALVDFAYEEGDGALGKSTLIKKARINISDPTIYRYGSSGSGLPIVDSCEFMKWVRAAGQVVDDILWRRKREADLWAGKTITLKK